MKSLYKDIFAFAIEANDNITPANGSLSINQVDAAIPEFWANIALGALGANTVMANLVNRDYDDVVATKGDVVNIVSRGALTVNDKNPGQTITLQTPQNTKTPVCLNKHKEISWLIEDAAGAKAITDAVNYVQDAAIALGEQIDKDLLELYSSCTLSAGTSGQAVNLNAILEAREKLNIAKAPTSGRYVVLSPEDETALLKIEQFTSAEWDNENQVALREAILGRKYGFTFVMDQQVAKTGLVGKQTRHNLAFHRDAFVLVTRPLPAPPAGSGAVSSTLQVDGISVRVTRSYSQKDGGTLWTLDVLYGVAALRAATHAVCIHGGDANATAPFSVTPLSSTAVKSGDKVRINYVHAQGTVTATATDTNSKLTATVKTGYVEVSCSGAVAEGAKVTISDGTTSIDVPFTAAS